VENRQYLPFFNRADDHVGVAVNDEALEDCCNAEKHQCPLCRGEALQKSNWIPVNKAVSITTCDARVMLMTFEKRIYRELGQGAEV